MKLLEAKVHTTLRAFLREQAESSWEHHLTMGRLVSRALRLQRSALIQTGSTGSRYRFSYLMPAILSDRSCLLVTPPSVQERLLEVEIPRLQEWLRTDKEIKSSNSPLNQGDQGSLILVSPQEWLSDRLENLGRFPLTIPTLIDQADDLETWTRQYFTVTIKPQHWSQLQQTYSGYGNFIQEVRLPLQKAIFSHPQNPYECWLLDEDERHSLSELGQAINQETLLSWEGKYASSVSVFRKFWQQLKLDNQLLWASINRENEEFTLHLSPIDVASSLCPIWPKSPVVLIGGFLDAEKTANTYRKTIGLDDNLLCLKFSPNRQNESIQLYIPNRLPLPNTPQFQGMFQEQCDRLIESYPERKKPIVIIVDDVPLKAQVGTALAAKWGSLVQVEKLNLSDNGILISGWEFWHQYQEELPITQLLIIATLPIPSLENPLVAGRVAYYKGQHQDWFRLYLLPTALKAIQRAVMPLRESQGVVALLDNRVNSRSYGTRILEALEPYAKINYIDDNWFR